MNNAPISPAAPSLLSETIRAAKKAVRQSPIGPPLVNTILYVKDLVKTPRPAPNSEPIRAPFYVVGLLSSPTGLGEAARLTANALESLGQQVTRVDVTRTLLERSAPIIEGPPLEQAPGTLIIVLNAPHTQLVLQALGAARIAGKRIVGFWHWELPKIPSSWRRSLPYLHEIWAPTRFVAEAVGAVEPIPIRVLAHPVRLPDFTATSRAAMGLDPKEFIALSLFNLDSGFHRKNPLGTISAFRSAFADRDGFRLLIKTRSVAGHEREKAALAEAVGGAKNITWLDRTMSNNEIASLVKAADVVMTLHRSEGFGLVPAQAMLLGTPIIATNWSSTTDFLTEQNAALVRYRLVPVSDPFGIYKQRAAVWAEPDAEHAASWLRELAANSELRARLSAQAKADAERAFSVTAFARTLGIACP